ncbi:ribonuclease III [bacterium]|nr:ribonuclease III [bacterium]
MIGYYRFKNKKLLQQALTHPSLNIKGVQQPNYQRLEYLGDSTLGFVIATYLYNRFPDYTDGELSILKNELVKTERLNELGKYLDIPQQVVFGKGDISKTGPNNPSIIEDVVEAIIGAIYLDSGLDEAKKWILHYYELYFLELIDSEELLKKQMSSVSKLQVLSQDLYKEIPTYELLEKTGKEHSPIFKMIGIIKEFKAISQGSNKREAMERIAKKLISKIEKKLSENSQK